MIKKTGLIFFIALLHFSAFPQIQIGLKGGYTFLSISDWNDYGTDKYTTPQPSYSYSVFARQRKPRIFNLGVEIDYSHSFFHVNSLKGYETKYGSYTLENLDLSADFLKVLIQPQFTFGSRFKFFIDPGIFFGFHTHSKIQGYLADYTNDSLDYYYYVYGSASGHLSDFEFGFLLGAGTDIPLYHGLTMVIECMQTMTFPPLQNTWGYGKGILLFETNFSVGLAYNIPIKKRKREN